MFLGGANNQTTSLEVVRAKERRTGWRGRAEGDRCRNQGKSGWKLE